MQVQNTYSTLFNYYKLCYDFVSVPQEDPSGHSIVLSGWDFDRIKNAARVLSPEEKRAAAERMKAAKEEALVKSDRTVHYNTLIPSRNLQIMYC